MKEDIYVDKNVIKIINLKDQKNDFNYWQTQSYQKRLQTLEEIRQEYNNWKYGSKQGFQRVYRIVELS